MQVLIGCPSVTWYQDEQERTMELTTEESGILSMDLAIFHFLVTLWNISKKVAAPNHLFFIFKHRELTLFVPFDEHNS